MVLDRIFREHQLLSDFFVREALGHQPEHLFLAQCKPFGRVSLLTRTVYDYSAGFPGKEAPLDSSVKPDGDLEAERAALIEAIINTEI